MMCLCQKIAMDQGCEEASSNVTSWVLMWEDITHINKPGITHPHSFCSLLSLSLSLSSAIVHALLCSAAALQPASVAPSNLHAINVL